MVYFDESDRLVKTERDWEEQEELDSKIEFDELNRKLKQGMKWY